MTGMLVVVLLVVSAVLATLAAFGVGGRVGLFPLAFAVYVVAALVPHLSAL